MHPSVILLINKDDLHFVPIIWNTVPFMVTPEILHWKSSLPHVDLLLPEVVILGLPD